MLLHTITLPPPGTVLQAESELVPEHDVIIVIEEKNMQISSSFSFRIIIYEQLSDFSPYLWTNRRSSANLCVSESFMETAYVLYHSSEARGSLCVFLTVPKHLLFSAVNKFSFLDL